MTVHMVYCILSMGSTEFYPAFNMFCSEVIILAAFSQAYTFTLWSFAERRFMTYDYYEIRTKRSDEKLQTAESLTKLCQVLANWPRECFDKTTEVPHDVMGLFQDVQSLRWVVLGIRNMRSFSLALQPRF